MSYSHSETRDAGSHGLFSCIGTVNPRPHAVVEKLIKLRVTLVTSIATFANNFEHINL